ncbi:phage tail repeat-like family [Trichomonas vaginalis G3]|uniref:phage tail repeat-like family n=1 Tax=Trichomonas vaginalis (strain ATCC PRA-98 / G3) TaxID=412133 RepID=UPI0021E5B8AF|nr:phage tail repeat-like family [Trichomonas vaginalis G3]KAI5535172.1 phage tail repeat-like family [Trichomonas vaginalis G3]
MTDEFLFQDNKNHTVCINPTKGTLNEKPINELLLKADVDNKADKEYVDDAIAKEEERANNAYATKEHTHPELADKTYVDNKMSSEVTRAENEYSKKTHTHSISEITDLQETLNSKSAVGHTHTIANITNLQETLNSKSAVGHTHTIANITNLQETLNRKSAVGHTHTSSEITDLNVSLEKKADKTYVNGIYQSLIGTTKNIETIVGDVSIYEENKYFRWEFVHSLKNGTRCKLIPKNNNEMYVSYIKNDGTQVKVPLDNNCYLNLYGDEQKKYLRVYEMTDMTLPDPAPAPYYYDYGDDVRTPHVDEQKLTLYLDFYRYKIYAIEKTRIVYYYEDDRNKYYSQDFTYPENIRLYYKKYSDTNQKKPEIVALYFKFKRDNPIMSHMFDLMNPVGSIYTSMEARGPQVMFGVGAWEQIVDRFLYCANSSKETGGSKTISGENLPAHSHYIDLSTSQAGWHKHRYWDWSGMTKGQGYDVKDDVKFAINIVTGMTLREKETIHISFQDIPKRDKVKNTCTLHDSLRMV